MKKSNYRIVLSRGVSTYLVLVYLAISIGVALQISGSNWDIIWHGIGNVESFFTPPHSVIYSGVALAIGSIILAIFLFTVMEHKKGSRSISSFYFPRLLTIPFSLKLAVIGSLLQLTAGPFDFWWHNQFGFDGLLSPPHSVLASGMLMVALGALIGIYTIKRDNNTLFFSKVCLAIAFAVFLMVAVGMVLMFTLPFSKGQYFNFNPDPLVAVAAASIVIPFLIGLCLFLAARVTSMPFIFTSITAIIMLIQSTTTIISNSYFVGIFPFYLLNIFPAMLADIILQYRRGEGITLIPASNTTVKRYLIASIIVPLFFTTIFFPWSVDVYGGFFKPSDNIRTEKFFMQLLMPVIIPIVIPLSAVSSMAGEYLVLRFMNANRMNSMF
ncbi:MAG TPA: hypothetical protein VE244_13160 [Nitrososphaeraceae archaeon]|nr:hypothetical protein [Nitrososphaeraceae archaeon]